MIDSRMVLVAIEDGFEIPVLVNDIVIVNRQQVKTRAGVDVEAIKREAEERAAAEDKARKSGLRRFAKNPEVEGIYFAFVPHEQQWILTGLMDVVLVNHTPATLLYSLTLSDEGSFSMPTTDRWKPAQKW